MKSDPPANRPGRPLGGVVHRYQHYDPQKLPPPLQPPPDMVSGAFDHMLMYGETRALTDEELARAVHLDPSQIQGLGPSLDALIQRLLERRRKILETFETRRVQQDARQSYHDAVADSHPPDPMAKRFATETRAQHLRGLEQMWYHAETVHPEFAAALLTVMEELATRYQIDELAARYEFTGRTALTIDEALAIKEELETIDRLLEQLKESQQNAQIAVVDLDALANFAEPGDVDQLRQLQDQIRDSMRDLAARQGIEHTDEGYRLTPKAYRLFQSTLLSAIFADLQAAHRGRHDGPIAGDGAVEMPRTRPYEFGDSVVHMDIPQSMINAMIRTAADHSSEPGRIRMEARDIEIHDTRNTPKCATTVIIDMSGSMRYNGLFINAKRMALALDGLVRTEYPGDYLRFVEMYSLAKLRTIAEIPQLMPKPVTIYDPVVRLRADMSDVNISELDIPPHFTNIQHSLQLSRQLLAAQDTPNRQIILITDGLPTAHFEAEQLFLLYPPHARTEEATMREAHLCQREGITINIFLLPNWNQSSEDVQFAHRMAEATTGRVFFTSGTDLDRFVVWDYVSRRRMVM